MLLQRESCPSGFKDGYLTETSEREHNGVPVQVESPIIQLECQSIYAEKWISFSFCFLCIWFASQVGKKLFTLERSGKGPKQSNKMMLRHCVKITAQLAAT